jgi:F-type H+-transporting ATPase subunit gamma
MPSLKEIRRRINSVKSTQKITRAMKLVSTAKFARANTAVVAARPYGKAFDAMVERLVAAAGDDIELELMQSRQEKKALIALVSTDRGFCGSLNANLFKYTLGFIAKKRKEGVEIEMITLGKRARTLATKLKYKVVSSAERVLERPNYDKSKQLADDLVQHFTTGGYDRVYLAFVEFKSALSQQPTVLQILPVGRKAGTEPNPADANIIVEPALKDLLPGLLKRQIASVVFRSLLEGSASEHGARMTAMDSATNNANEVLKRKKLEYNRARQAAITKELIEITSGAQAL